jgi:uncharacterized lipoprotein YmbA
MKWVGAVCLCALIAQAGCISLGRAELAQRHYVLGGSVPAEVTPSAEVADVAVGLRRMKLASYLAVPFIAVRRGPNQIDFSDFHRWGEPLDAGINRVVARLLASRGFRDVAVAPWPAGARYDYVIQLDVTRFEGVIPPEGGPAEGEVHLSATWEIIRQQDGVVLTRGITDRRSPGWTVGDHAGLVTLLDEELDVLAGDLMAGIAGLGPPPRGPRESR